MESKALSSKAPRLVLVGHGEDRYVIKYLRRDDVLTSPEIDGMAGGRLQLRGQPKDACVTVPCHHTFAEEPGGRIPGSGVGLSPPTPLEASRHEVSLRPAADRVEPRATLAGQGKILCASLRGERGSHVKIRKEDGEWIGEKRSSRAKDDRIPHDETWGRSWGDAHAEERRQSCSPSCQRAELTAEPCHASMTGQTVAISTTVAGHSLHHPTTNQEAMFQASSRVSGWLSSIAAARPVANFRPHTPLDSAEIAGHLLGSACRRRYTRTRFETSEDENLWRMYERTRARGERKERDRRRGTSKTLLARVRERDLVGNRGLRAAAPVHAGQAQERAQWPGHTRP